MPALRDFVFDTQDATGESQILSALPIYEANDLLLLFVASDTGSSSFNLCRLASDFSNALSCQFYNANTTVYTDETADINNATATDVNVPPQQATTVGDCIYFGHNVPFTALRINTGTARVGTGITIVWEYWNGSWTTLTVTDGTNGFTTTGRQNVTWTLPGDWATTTVYTSGSLYWVRARCSAVTTVTTPPKVTQGWLMHTAWTSEAIANQNSEITCANYYLVPSDVNWTQYILNRAANETYVTAVLSIEDVNTSTPINTKNSATSSAATNNMPTVTTTVDDCMLVYFVGCDAARIPTICDGPASALFAIDGTGVSFGGGIGYLENYGTSSSSVRKYLTQADGNCLVTLAIAPPGGGVTVRPTHLVTNGFYVVDWLNGTTVMGSNLHNQTLTTLLSTCDGVTCTNLAWTASADSGVNPFHGSALLTVAVYASRQYQGARLTFSAVDFSDCVLLIHGNPSTIKEGQDVSFYYNEGMVVVLGDSSNYWRAYKVFGQGDENRPEAFQIPFIIDPTDTATDLDASGSLDETDITQVAIMATPKQKTGTNTGIFTYKQVMRVGKTTVAGGIAAAPMTLESIFNVVTANENRGMTRLGNSLYKMLFPLQIGDLGTNTVYCNIDSSGLEFPRIADATYKALAYHGKPGWAGIIYAGGSGDTIKHTNSVVSSPSPFQWGFASGAASATYDFSGLQIIGADPITLISGVTLDGVSFSQCGEIDTTGATIQNCIINDSIDTAAMIIDSVAELDEVTDCQFTNNTRAIKITTAGTYTLDGCTFSGNTYDIENSSSGLVTINCINGANASTYINTGGGTITISNPKILTLSGLQTNSKVEILLASTQAILDGTDSSSTSFAYNYTYDVGTANIIIVVVHIDYLAIWMPYTLTATNQTIPISQTTDRSFYNP